MSRQRQSFLLAWYGCTILVSAFLVFQVQPVISKMILPWFGGSPAVWTTCLLFFQATLFLGYAYAHCLTRWFPPSVQGGVHLLLIMLALLLIPISPDSSWKPTGAELPTSQILALLTAHVGMPYFLLSATGPLLQSWFSRTFQGVSPYRLYALSNVGSLAGLLTYPVLIEPTFTSRGQDILFTLGFCGFALGCGYLAGAFWKNSPWLSDADCSEHSTPVDPAVGTRRTQRLGWLLYPAFASVMLLATTNHVCTDIAVVPFLWVLPLSLYLLSFIVCFARDSWYSRRIYAGLTLCGLTAISVALSEDMVHSVVFTGALYFATLFAVCMLCHGELFRSRPAPQHLTSFYLMSGAGGAVGGIVVALVCPWLFRDYYEVGWGLIGSAVLSVGILYQDARTSWLAAAPARQRIVALAGIPIVLFIALAQLVDTPGNSLETTRNFYGVLRVQQRDYGEQTRRARLLVHGRTLHGFQFQDPDLQLLPTTYYSHESGVGRALLHYPKSGPLRVGVVGLGCGTLATYARPEDYYRFYEINPEVPRLAEQYFTYLENCKSNYDIVLGDARISLEREPAQNFDVLVLDAFSSDAIPAHLLTLEAFREYLRHLRQEGVIAVHISNKQLDLSQVVARLSDELELPDLLVRRKAEPRLGVSGSSWILLSRHPRFFENESVRSGGLLRPSGRATGPLWTDQYNNLFELLYPRFSS